MAGELAYDPATGQLVYSPATGQLALDCAGEPECPCPAAYPCGGLSVADSFQAILSGVAICDDSLNECIYLSAPEVSFKPKSISLDEAGDCLAQEVPDGDESCLWGDEYGVGTTTNLGHVVVDLWLNNNCYGDPSGANAEFDIYGEFTVDYSTMTARFRAWLMIATDEVVLFDGTAEVSSACESELVIDNSLELGDCAEVGSWPSGMNLGYGGSVTLTRCCLE
jgi:hypothetical protein